MLDKLLAFSAFVLVAAQPLVGQGSCHGYVGTQVRPIKIETVMQFVSKLPREKGEFETTKEFRDRQAQLMKVPLGEFIVNSEIKDGDYLEYDADAQRLTVRTYALSNTNLIWETALGSGNPSVPFDISFNKAIAINQVDTPSGKYIASNAFGASFRVTAIKRTETGIFDHAGHVDSPDMFPSADPHQVLDKLSLSPSQAKELKATFKIAFVVIPKAPYVVTGTRRFPPTVDSPEDITSRMSLLIANIKCGLLIDGNGQVLGAYETP